MRKTSLPRREPAARRWIGRTPRTRCAEHRALHDEPPPAIPPPADRVGRLAMCGIAGFVNRDGRPADGGLLRAMTDMLIHRGPDGEGHYVSGPVALGHRRLAIIDLVTGAPPMANDDGAGGSTCNRERFKFSA